MILYKICNFGQNEEQLRSKHNQYALLQRTANYYLCFGAYVIGNSEFDKCFLIKMAICVTPIPIAVMMGTNITLGEIDVINDGFYVFHDLFRAVYMVPQLLQFISYMKKRAIEEENSKLETLDLLKTIVNNLKESIMICSNKQIDYANDLFVNKF